MIVVKYDNKITLYHYHISPINLTHKSPPSSLISPDSLINNPLPPPVMMMGVEKRGGGGSRIWGMD